MVEPERTYWSVPLARYVSNVDSNSSLKALSIQVINNATAMKAYEQDWNSLVLNSSATIFQTFDWQFHWWKHFGNHPEHHLFILLFKKGEQLVGIAPLFIQSHSWKGYRLFSRIMLLGSGLKEADSPVPSLEKEGPSDYLDIIAKSGFEQDIAATFVSYLQHKSHLWNEIDFQNIREDGILFNHVLPVLSEHNFRIKKKVTDVCPKVPLPESPETATNLTVLSNPQLRHQDWQSLELTIEDAGGSNKITSALQSLSHLHQKRWNAAGYPGLFSDPRFEDFQRDVSKAMAEKGWMWAKQLRHNGNNIATHVGFTFNGRTYTYIGDHDHEQEDESISISDMESPVLHNLIEEAIQSNCQVLEMGRGENSYKLKLTSQVTNNWEITVRSPNDLPTSHRPQHPGQSLVLKLHHLGLRIMARMIYEWNITKVIHRERSALMTIPTYFYHFFKRMKNRRENLSLLERLGIHKPNLFFTTHSQTANSSDKTGHISEADFSLRSFVEHSDKLTSRSQYNIDFITRPAEIEQIIREWDEMESNFNTPLLASEWFQAAAETFCPPDRLNMIVLRKEGELQAVAPLSVKGSFRPRLELVGSSTLREPGGFLYRDQSALTTLIQTLLKSNKPLFLRGLRLLSTEVQSIETELAKGDYLSVVSEQRIPFVDIHQDWADFEMDHLSSSRRSSLRRLQRKAEKEGKLHFEVIAPTPDNVDAYLDEVYRVEAANWKGRSGTAIKTHPKFSQFFQIYAKQAAAKGKLRLFFLKLNDQTIAVQYNVVHSGRLWIYKIGHDEEYNWCSPGILLMHNVVQYAFEQDLDGCEFLGQDESWLHIWANEFHSLVNYHIYAKSMRGLLDFSWDHSKNLYHNLNAKLHAKLHH